jgi:hypothetical protein
MQPQTQPQTQPQVQPQVQNQVQNQARDRVQTQVHSLDGHRVTLDVYPAVGPVRGAAILSHGFTRCRRCGATS